MDSAPQTVPLDNVEHHDLRVIAGHSAQYGDNINQVPVFAPEFAEVQREYPIFFRRDAQGAFQAYALTGFDAGENLFLDGSGWQAGYVPAMQQRGPFLIGFRENTSDDGETQTTPMVMLNPGHPRLSKTEGDPLFLEHGGNTPVLDRYTRNLRTIHQGVGFNQTMFAAFLDAGLIAPVNVEIRIDEDLNYKIPDLFSISQEALTKLDGAALARLNQAGFLALAFHVLASVGNIKRLIDLKTRKRQGG